MGAPWAGAGGVVGGLGGDGGQQGFNDVAVGVDEGVPGFGLQGHVPVPGPVGVEGAVGMQGAVGVEGIGVGAKGLISSVRSYDMITEGNNIAALHEKLSRSPNFATNELVTDLLLLLQKAILANHNRS